MTLKKLQLALIIIISPLTLIAQAITLEPFGPNFDNPTNMQHAGDDLFIVDQEGYIRILKPNGTSPATPFLDIESRVNNQGASWEAGLLGLTFHPNYSSNGYFYVYYVNLGGNNCIVSRFTRNNSNSNLANPNSELIILEIPIAIGFTHFGGDLQFNSDGTLYISTGDDGTSAGDAQNVAQNLNSLRGKILRIDVDNPTGGKAYDIPASNPYQNDGNPNTLGEIWAYGLRNPAKFSFDSSNGDMWIADVGHELYEEVNLSSGNISALNYGWPCYEANATFNNPATPPGSCPNMSSLTFPVNDYPRNIPGGPTCAVIGGYRYRGTMQPNLAGKYFFADWCSDQIFILTKNGGSWSRESYEPSISTQNWTSFAEGNNNELYIIGNSGGSGKVYKIKQEGGLSTNSFNVNMSFSVIPNPTSNKIATLTFLKNVDLKEINTYNLHGQKVKSNVSPLNPNTVNLELIGLASGIYIIEAISITGEKSQNKLIIE